MVQMQRYFVLKKKIWYQGTDAEIFYAKGDLVPLYTEIFCAKGDKVMPEILKPLKMFCFSHGIV